MKTASKRFAAWLFALALCLTLFLAAAVPVRAAGDSGIVWNESDQRYEISDYAGLLEFAAIVNGTHPSIRQNKSACAILTKDIDASASANYEINPDNAWTPIGNGSGSGSNQIRYTGTFDGRGCVITGLTYNNDQKEYVGLFGYVGSGGLVENVGLEGGSMTGSNYVGGVVGRNSATVTNCYNTGGVSGEYWVGGVAGHNSKSVKDCYHRGKISCSGYYAGGVVGYIDGGSVESCYSAATFEGGGSNVGGVAGYNHAELKNCCYDSDLAGSVTDAVGSSDAWGTISGTVTGLPTDQMTGEAAKTNMKGFNFRTTWATVENDYPIFGSSLPDTTLQGDGSEDNPYQITSYVDLKEFARIVNEEAYYEACGKLMNKIDASASKIDNDWTPIGPDEAHAYVGTFDGNHQIITGLSMDRSFTSGESHARFYAGLFGVLGKGGTVQDLYLKDCSFTATAKNAYNATLCLGAVAGWSKGTITACACYGTSTVIGTAEGAGSDVNVGGVVGYAYNSGIKDCCFSGTGAVIGKAERDISYVSAGGIVGYADGSGTIENCFHTGAVSASAENDVYVGGVVGWNSVDVRNCRHVGSVEGSKASSETGIGGVAGANVAKGSVTNCYARSTLEATGSGSGDLNIGGVVGKNYGTVSDCAYDQTLAPDCSAVNNVNDGTDEDVVALASEDFADASKFSGWDEFDKNWTMGADEPELISLSAEIHLYANNNEDLIIEDHVPICTAVKFANPFTYTGHSFTGWKEHNGDTIYSEDDAFTLLRGEKLSLDAQWGDKQAIEIGTAAQLRDFADRVNGTGN